MRVVSTLLMMAISTLFVPGALAQTLNFTNDFNLATGEHADLGLLQPKPDLAHFPAGSPIWAVLNPASAGYVNVNAFSGKPQGGGSIRRTVEIANGYGGWKLVSSELMDVPASLGTHKSLVLQIIPNKPNDSQQFNQLLDVIAAHKGPDPILVRVRIEGGDDPRQFSQNGFYLDIANGLGRYGEWLAQRAAAIKTANDNFEQQHIHPRTDFVTNYRSLKSDPKFVADVRKWWSEKEAIVPLSTKICSADYIFMRNNLGVVTEKQLCALVTYKNGTRCFAMMRRFSYRYVGGGTFDNELVDATYAIQSLPADEGENFFGASPYEIACGATR